MFQMSMIIENRYTRILHHIDIKDIKSDNEPEPQQIRYVDPQVVGVQKSNWRDDLTNA